MNIKDGLKSTDKRKKGEGNDIFEQNYKIRERIKL